MEERAYVYTILRPIKLYSGDVQAPRFWASCEFEPSILRVWAFEQVLVVQNLLWTDGLASIYEFTGT